MPRHFEAQSEIDAPAELVWKILVDLASYAEWNTFCPRVDSTLAVGSPAVLHVQLGKRKVLQHEIVQAHEPGAKICWGTTIGAAFVFAAARWQVVEPIGRMRSRYLTHERFTGLLSPAIGAAFGADVQRGFDDTARNLKRRAEQLRTKAG